MSYVVIGVHGRAPKPEQSQLKYWWHQAVLEGLERNEHRSPDNPIEFELAYYADVFHEPLSFAQNDEPYAKAKGTGPLPTYEAFHSRAYVSDKVDDLIDAVRHHIGQGGLAEEALKQRMRDLHQYYADAVKRSAVQQALRNVLEPELNRGKRIMLIGHSMGTIVAYDVLRDLGRENPSQTVQHFITLGSPLGLPYVKYMIQAARDQVRTPSIVEKWSNFSDPDDWVSADTHLQDDYAPNTRGIAVADDLVINGYVSPKTGQSNEHKSYGYLRTPEFSRVVRTFL